MDEKTRLEKAISILQEGGIVIYPTDTAFGIGCRIDNQTSVEHLFEIRQRPKNQPTPVLVDSTEMAQEYLEPIPNEVREKLMEKYWPGGLTIILYCNKVKVPKLVRGGGDTLGVRIPTGKVILDIIKGVGVPILAPSANFHGEKTPFTFQDLDKRLLGMVDYVVRGKCLLKKPSTIVDCTRKPWKIIRHGAVAMAGITQ